jgi:hypothetical protein
MITKRSKLKGSIQALRLFLSAALSDAGMVLLSV